MTEQESQSQRLDALQAALEAHIHEVADTLARHRRVTHALDGAEAGLGDLRERLATLLWQVDRLAADMERLQTMVVGEEARLTTVVRAVMRHALQVALAALDAED